MTGERLAAPAGTFEITPRGPYSLAASTKFLEGFSPAAYESGGDSEMLSLAFVVDGGDDVAGVSLHEEGGVVVGEVFGASDPDIVQRQVARILSLDIDGSGFPAVGERDRVIGDLQRRYPSLRPVCFFSPYEAAAWALIGHRIRIRQAATIKARMSEQLGTAVSVHGRQEYAFPGPSRLAQLEEFPGLFGRKVEYLRQLGEATLAGELDATMLRSLPADQAMTRLKRLPGIGDFSAQLILLRGAGNPDSVPTYEERLRRAVARAYSLDHLPDTTELIEIAEQWRPYRTWVSLLLRVMLEEETHEITGS